MNFANAMREETNWTYTENGMLARSTSGDDLLNLFSVIGALREADESRITSLFDAAFAEDKLRAMKMIFYARDVRGGLGERRVFRVLIKHIANRYPEAMRRNIHLIGEYGRFDDLYELVDTPVENYMWEYMEHQLLSDIGNYKNNKPISLLAKWIKSPATSSKESKRLGKLTARKLGYSEQNFRKVISSLRKYLRVVEKDMCSNDWQNIEYSQVSSNAMKNYSGAFSRHDTKRFAEFISNVNSGKEKINSNTLYPYDIIRQIWEGNIKSSSVAEAQWKALPNYVQAGQNVLVVADTSGSMYGRPMETSVGLAVYFAERNVGAYHNMFMTFSENPSIITLKDSMTLVDKIRKVRQSDWGFSTNIEAAFEKILNIAIKNHIRQEEMVKSIVIISDMEFNHCVNTGNDGDFYTTMKKKFRKAGYELPNVVFWNVYSRHDLCHASSTSNGVQLVSGQSASTFKNLINCIGSTPVEAMYKILDSERYSMVTV